MTRALDLTDVSRRDRHRIDRIQGRDFIERFMLRIGYAAKTLEVHDPGSPPL